MFRLPFQTPPHVAAHRLHGSGGLLNLLERGCGIVVQPIEPALHARACEVIESCVRTTLERPPAGVRYLALDLRNVKVLSAMSIRLLGILPSFARRAGLEPVLFGVHEPLRAQLQPFGVERHYRVVRARDEFLTLLAA
jgi:anti-anti-sigma regulatory factor